jgi:hypothetical protein
LVNLAIVHDEVKAVSLPRRRSSYRFLPARAQKSVAKKASVANRLLDLAKSRAYRA